MIVFGSPHTLWLLVIVPFIYWYYMRTVARLGIRFSSIELVSRVKGNTVHYRKYCLALMRSVILSLLIMGLARPQIEKSDASIQQYGIDIMLAVDVSSSMLALDFSQKGKLTTRLEAILGVISDFIEKRVSDRIGMIVFAGNPYLFSPLTTDHGWLKKNMERIGVGLIEDGTAIGDSIVMAINRLRGKEQSVRANKVIILLTDGVNNQGKVAPLMAAKMAKELSLKIYTIGVGKGGVVPALYLDSQNQIAKNVWGQPDIIQTNTPIDEKLLQDIADYTEGAFFRAKDRAELASIYAKIDALEKTTIDHKRYAEYQELFYIPILLAMVLLFLEKILTIRVWRYVV